MFGVVLALGRQYPQAIEQYSNVLDRAPEFVETHYYASLAHTALSMHAEAVDHAENAVRLSRRLPFQLGVLGRAYVHAGRRSEAEGILEELRTRDDREYVPPLALAVVFMALGDAEHAFELLEREYRDRGIMLWLANVQPLFDDFRADPRFQALLRRMNFPQ